MTITYLVRIRNRAGIRQWDVGDFLSLNYSKIVNDVGSLTVDLAGNHEAIATLERDGQVEIWRYDDVAGITPYCDFYGLYRDFDMAHQGDSVNGVYTLKCVGQKHFLKRAIDGFPAGVNDRNDFTTQPAETVMKLMVQYNATADATVANGRLLESGTFANYITVATDTGAGTSITKAFAHRNLLEALQEIATLGGLDFELVKTGAQAWEFRTYTLLGTDLSAIVKFSMSWGNMRNPQLTGGNLDESTVAIVGGEGDGDARDFLVRTGPNYDVDDNHIEFFVNASNQFVDSLEAAGDARLNEVRARQDLRFDVLNQGAYRYGQNYCAAGALGDKVTVNYAGVSLVKKITGVHIAVSNPSGSDKAEQIRLDMVTAL